MAKHMAQIKYHIATEGNGDEPETLDVCHLVSLSQGFEERSKCEDIRFATKKPTSSVIKRLERVAAKAEGRMRVMKSSAAGVCLEGERWEGEAGGGGISFGGRSKEGAQVYSGVPELLQQRAQAGTERYCLGSCIGRAAATIIQESDKWDWLSLWTYCSSNGQLIGCESVYHYSFIACDQEQL